VRGALAHELAHLEVHHAREVEGEGLLRRVERIADPLHQRVRTGNRDLRLALRELLEEAHLVEQPERPGCQLRSDDAVVEVVVQALRSVIDQHAGNALGEVVDHVVAMQLAIRDDVDAGCLLVLDGRLAPGVVHLVKVVPADFPLQEVVLGALEPCGHRVAADDGRRERW
jgi:hypothetical protein